VHIVLGYGSGDAVQISRSQCAEPSARTMGSLTSPTDGVRLGFL
jgi:hypothetical protein